MVSLGALDPFLFFFELNLMKFINAEPVPGFSELIQMKISVLSEKISKTPNNQAPTLQIISIRPILELIGVEIFQRKLLWRFPGEFSGAGASINDVKVPAQQKDLSNVGQAGLEMAQLKFSGLLLK